MPSSDGCPLRSSPGDASGLWFAFSNYKSALAVRRGVPTELSDTIPNVGRANPGTYLPITTLFREHWERVNAVFATAGAAPFVIGPLDLATLSARETQLEALTGEIGESDSTQVRITRARVERIFGAVPAARRTPIRSSPASSPIAWW